MPRPHPAYTRRRGLVSQVTLAPESWRERPMKLQSGVYWNNAEADEKVLQFVLFPGSPLTIKMEGESLLSIRTHNAVTAIIANAIM